MSRSHPHANANRLDYYASGLRRLVQVGDILPVPKNQFWPQLEQRWTTAQQKLNEAIKAVILIFDGLRVDAWEGLVRPVLEEKYDVVQQLPGSAILPTETHLSRKAISAGCLPVEFCSTTENALLENALKTHLGLTVKFKFEPAFEFVDIRFDGVLSEGQPLDILLTARAKTPVKDEILFQLQVDAGLDDIQPRKEVFTGTEHQYLIDNYCTEDNFQDDLQQVIRRLRENFVHGAEAEKIRHQIRESRSHSIIASLEIRLQETEDKYWGTIGAINESFVNVTESLVRQYPMLLSGGMWGTITLTYDETEVHNKKIRPFKVSEFTPFQISVIDLNEYIEKRRQFEADQWLDILINSIEMNPEPLTRREKLLYLLRLVPMVEANCNTVELAPRETARPTSTPAAPRSSCPKKTSETSKCCQTTYEPKSTSDS